MDVDCINNQIYRESARVYTRRDKCPTILIKCCLCSAAAYPEWNLYLKHLTLHQNLSYLKSEDDDEIEAEIEVERANLRKATEGVGLSLELTDEEDAECPVDHEEEEYERIKNEQSVMKAQLDKDKSEHFVFNDPKRPFYSLLRTTVGLMHHFIRLLGKHNCLWNAQYKGAEFKELRLNRATQISDELAQRWHVFLLPQVVCTSARTLQRWFEVQYTAQLRDLTYHCRYPEYYAKLLQFLPTSHLRPIICDECSKCFKSQYYLRQHKFRIHSGATPHTCDECDMSFHHASKLRIHKVRHHTVLTQWQCKQCAYNAPTKWDFCQHMTIHSDERNFICEQCGSGYKTSTALAVHRRTHQAPRLECSYCQKKFHENYRLKMHIRKMHESENARNFVCKMCRQRFETAKLLELHQIIHRTADAN